MTDNSTLTHFNWSFKEKQYILSSYFWGYIILIIPGGYLCQRFGSKVVLSISCLINTIIWLVTPLILRIGGWEAFCIIRATQGISQSVVLAGIFSSLSHLFPKEEVPLIGSLIASGFEVGMIISTAICGFIIQSSLGWPGIYFIFGGISSVITTLWALFGNDGTGKQLDRREFLSVPWKDILKCPPFLSLLFVIAVQELEAESLIVIAASSNGFHDIAYTTNIIDLSPNYVAILSAIMDLCTSLVQLIASLVLSQINVRGWNAVFFINASLLPIAGILYILFGTTELQPWNSKEETKTETKAKTIKPSAERTG
uniref:Major facilitator superfamily (MFS) profile domain-containing protein n=1 Tax=Megaselia scalaris TaxID=36166 RepID=T1GUW9_MEGSC